jgi:acyl carrier protein
MNAVMQREELRSRILQALTTVAPEADCSTLKPNVRFREQLDLDSMDMLNFMIRLHEVFGVDVPERDYGKLMTLDGCLAYLAQRVGID